MGDLRPSCSSSQQPHARTCLAHVWVTFVRAANPPGNRMSTTPTPLPTPSLTHTRLPTPTPATPVPTAARPRTHASAAPQPPCPPHAAARPPG
eukprot:361945-Chlamydomonas_euryale.AAC.2